MSTETLAVINVTKGTEVKTKFGLDIERKLGEAFKFDDWKYIVVTEAQAKSYERVRDQQGPGHLETFYSHLMGCLMVEYPDICIGIESDGYAHS